IESPPMHPRATRLAPVPRQQQPAMRPVPPNQKQPESKLAWSPSYTFFDYETWFALADRFDFHQQILAANVGLQVQDMCRRAQGQRQRGPDRGEILRSSYINFQLEAC